MSYLVAKLCAVSKAAKLIVAGMYEDANVFADAVKKRQKEIAAREQSASPRPIEQHDASAEMVTEAERLIHNGLRITWPLDMKQVMMALNSFVTDAEGQEMLFDVGKPVKPKSPCEKCNDPNGILLETTKLRCPKCYNVPGPWQIQQQNDKPICRECGIALEELEPEPAECANAAAAGSLKGCEGVLEVLCETCREDAVAQDEDGNPQPICLDCSDNLRTCERCDKFVLEDAERDVGGDNTCQECCDNFASHCISCEEPFWSEDGVVTANGDAVCDSCYSEYFGSCEECGEIYHSEDFMWVEGEEAQYCEECFSNNYTMCERCQKSSHLDSTYRNDDGEDLCESCAEDDGITDRDPLGGTTGGALHSDIETDVKFDRPVKSTETPLADRLLVLTRLLGEKGEMAIARLKKARPKLIESIMADIDLGRLSVGNKITKEKVERAIGEVEEEFGDLRVSQGRWAQAQRLYKKDNIVFRLDVRDLIESLRAKGDEDNNAAASLLDKASRAAMKAHPTIPGSSIGWARVVVLSSKESFTEDTTGTVQSLGDTWYIEELQSDFDSTAAQVRILAKGKEVKQKLVSEEEARRAWPIIGELLHNWEFHLLAKIANIARENGVKNLAIISKKQLDEWTNCPKCRVPYKDGKCQKCGGTDRPEGPGREYDVSGKTTSIAKRKRYYQDAPRALGFEMQDAQIGGLQQDVWLRAASKLGFFERMAKLAAFELTIKDGEQLRGR